MIPSMKSLTSQTLLANYPPTVPPGSSQHTSDGAPYAPPHVSVSFTKSINATPSSLPEVCLGINL